MLDVHSLHGQSTKPSLSKRPEFPWQNCYLEKRGLGQSA